MKYKIITILSMLLLSNSYAQFTQSTTATPQAVAKLSASCTISAQNLTFGNLVLPVNAQGSASNMSVLCSANAPYTIGLAYGGVYGQGSGQTIYQNVFVNANPHGSNGALYEVVNTTTGAVYANYGTNTGSFSKICTTSLGGTVSGNNCTVGTAAYGYGKMIGVASGDFIAYKITVPDDSSKIWNAGNADYSATGTGVSQNISVNASIVPEQSSSAYPTPDMYMDTVTASINF